MSAQSTHPIPNVRAIVAGTAAVLILAYFFLVAGQVLLGGIVAGSVVLIERATHPEIDAASLRMPVAAIATALVLGDWALPDQFFFLVLVGAVVFSVVWTTRPD